MSKIPTTDSVTELAHFWDTHDLIDFEDELDEVAAPVFAGGRGNVLRVILSPEEAEALRQAAESQGVEQTALVREWVKEKLQAS
jgi:hypothetical protein